MSEPGSQLHVLIIDVVLVDKRQVVYNARFFDADVIDALIGTMR